jgi:hypothetical protein
MLPIISLLTPGEKIPLFFSYEGIQKRFLKSNGNLRGVYAIEGEVKEWLKKALHDTW